MKTAMKYQIIRLFLTLTLISGVCVANTAAQGGYSYGNPAGKNEACLNCHGDAQKVKGSSLIDQTQFAHTTHARIGCPACHDGISKGHPDGQSSPRANCQDCHGDINNEYAKSNHAGKAPCAGCHNPHKVETPREISGQEINRMCSGCHISYQILASHAEWLPQADLHLDMLPCITCHTESRNYSIIMYVVKRNGISRGGKMETATYDDLKKAVKGDSILTLIDGNGDNYISLAELRIFNSDHNHKSLRLHGMMTPETVTHNFRVLDNRRNCTFCHVSGPAAMQTSFVALPEKNGTFKQVAVEKGAVLDALYGTPDFYMMGATRNASLNMIGMFIIAGGLVLPVGHGSLRFLTRKNRNGKEHQS